MMASRELDKLVGEKVFGYEVVQHNQVGRPDWHYKLDGALILLPQYSKHIDSAWLVVEKMKTDRSFSDGFTITFDLEEKQWRAGALWWRGYEQAEWWEPQSAMAETAPLAICLAALAAVNVPNR